MVADFGGQTTSDGGGCVGWIHQGKFPTNVAEAVCMGYHVCHRLGWIQPHREPVVRRYTNGNIIIPTATTATMKTAPTTTSNTVATPAPQVYRTTEILEQNTVLV